MSSNMRPGSRPESPLDERIRAVVDSFVVDDSEKTAYVQFAHELMATVRHSGFVPRRAHRFLDYSVSTKLVVMKWFRRGLSGHLMWLIGRELIPEPEVFYG